MKKLATLIFAAMLAGQARAYDFQSGDLYYNITSDSTVEVTYRDEYNRSNSYPGLTEIAIPKTVTYSDVEYAVTLIGPFAFEECKGLTSVTIPESVTTIGDYAFNGCSGLETVNYNAKNCTSMGSYNNPVFSGCTSLITINVGDNVENIPNYAFCDCIGLTSVTIPESVTTIGNCAFCDCSGLTSVTIPESVTTIGMAAFRRCSSLTSVTIHKSVTSIDENAFSGCDATIYCEVSSKPDGWAEGWDGGCKVVWANSNSTTAVTETAANAVNIYAYGNKIVVENAIDEINVYDAMGRLIGMDATNRVRAEITINDTGVYIVKTGNVVKRVMVN